MKFTIAWLKDFLATEANIEQIIAALTSLGLEVEKISGSQKLPKELLIAEITEIMPHPNADRLRICMVNNGSEILQIVCGANNVKAGLKTVLASQGTIIPNGQFEIKTAKIRGIESNGMLCAADELLLPFAEEGILELPGEAKAGSSFAHFYDEHWAVIEVAVAPNRGDCLSVYGLARELAAKGVGTMKSIQLSLHEEKLRTSIQNLPTLVNHTALTQNFTLAYLQGIANQPSPDWLAKLLKIIGVKSISAIVDIANYICYSFGQPLHVYDADQLSGALMLTTLKNNVALQALDGNQYKLEAGDLVVQDAQGAVQALAGIIGSQSSSCTEQTKNIVIEAGAFACENIRKTGQRLRINTEAKYRFERQVDPAMTEPAILKAISLIQQVCNGEVSHIYSTKQQSVQRQILCDLNKFQSKIGVHLYIDEAADILKKLGCDILEKQEADSMLLIATPSWRHDLAIAEDIFEELIRIKGYGCIPCQGFIPQVWSTANINVSDLSRKVLAALGYDETITWSFMPSTKAQYFSEIKAKLMLQNPITQDLAYLRPSAIGNLLSLVERSQLRSHDNSAVFEIGNNFHKQGQAGLREELAVTVIRSGENLARNPHDKVRAVDFFDLKGDLTILLRELSIREYSLINADFPSYYHPKRAGTIIIQGQACGYIGDIHPMILKGYNIKGKVVGLELFLSKIEQNQPAGENKLAEYQIVQRDLAFIVTAEINAESMLKAFQDYNPSLIKEVAIFDIYQPSKVKQDQLSLAFTLTMQADNRTLTEAEISEVIRGITELAAAEFGAKTRD